jgi:hypothetical protein
MWHLKCQMFLQKSCLCYGTLQDTELPSSERRFLIYRGLLYHVAVISSTWEGSCYCQKRATDRHKAENIALVSVAKKMYKSRITGLYDEAEKSLAL